MPNISEACGIFLYELSHTADMRLASAGWSARTEDPSTVFLNPAGMSRLCDTEIQLDAGPIFQHIHSESPV
jgi:long-chain fatty acid transport protein